MKELKGHIEMEGGLACVLTSCIKALNTNKVVHQPKNNIAVYMDTGKMETTNNLVYGAYMLPVDDGSSTKGPAFGASFLSMVLTASIASQAPRIPPSRFPP